MTDFTPPPEQITQLRRIKGARRELCLKMMVIPFQQLWAHRDTLTLEKIQRDFPATFGSVGEVTEFQEVEHEGRQALSIRFLELYGKESTAHLLYLPGAKPEVRCEHYNPSDAGRFPMITTGGWLNALTKLTARVMVHYDEDVPDAE